MQIPNLVLAEQYFNQALNQNPDMPLSLLNLAKLKAKSGDTAGAHRYFNQFVHLASDQSPQQIEFYKRYVFSR